jgi:hypothetical protein
MAADVVDQEHEKMIFSDVNNPVKRKDSFSSTYVHKTAIFVS